MLDAVSTPDGEVYCRLQGEDDANQSCVLEVQVGWTYAVQADGEDVVVSLATGVVGQFWLHC